MNERPDIKIEFNSKEAGHLFIEEAIKSENEKSVIKDINSTISVQAFPTAKLTLNATPKYPNLIMIKSGDGIIISMKEKEKPYSKLIAGFILSVKVKTQKETLELEIECTSEFYKLQKKEISISDFSSTNGLREILNQIISISNINGEIKIDDNISNDYELSHFRNFPALALINSICFELDLVYDISKGDIMKFSKRKDVLHKMFNSKPIEIGDGKIISSKFEQ